MEAGLNFLEEFSPVEHYDLCPEVNSCFRYQSLDVASQEIRLVTILPDSTPTEIRCQTRTGAIRCAEPYTALSYTWGSPSLPQQSIELDGSRFMVRENLWRFLQHAVAQQSAPTHWWIDAICINQNDHRERSAQVGIMGKIYSQAENVLIWLGPGYHGSDEVMQMMQTRYGLERLKKWLVQHGDDVLSLWIRPYWGRLWTFQELVLAKKVKIMCGSKVATEQSFHRLFAYIFRLSLSSRSHGKLIFQYLFENPAMISIALRKRYEPGINSVWDLLRRTAHLQCQDPRDKVFALLAVAGSGKIGINTNYDVSLPTLLNQVLRAHQLEMDPMDCHEVNKQCHELARLFSIDTQDLFKFNGQNDRHSAPSQADIDFLQEHMTMDPMSPITLWWSVAFDHSKVTNLLMEGHIDKVTVPFFKAANQGFTAVVDVLLRAGVDINICNKAKKTALHCASQAGHLSIVRLLLGDSRVQQQLEDSKGETPLPLAAKNGHLSVMEALFQSIPSSDIYVRNREGQTPLHLAAYQGRALIVQALLIKSAAGIDMTDGNGQTALHLAESAGHPDAARFLKLNNAAVLALGNEGRAALDLATGNE